MLDFGTLHSSREGVTATFDSNGFTICGKDFAYSTLYTLSENDELKEWLKSENLECPWN